VADLPAHLPDAGIGEVPVPAHPIHQPAQHPPGAFGHFVAPSPDVGCLEDLAIDVELQLADRPIPHPDGPRAQVARQVVELTLHQIPSSVDAVHDLQVPAALVAADPLEEAHERIGLSPMTHGVQRGEGERRVAEPDEPIVPVANSPDGLREGSVGAAMTAPDSAWVSSLRASAERRIIERWGPR
jgi:hypothetical protein